MVRTSPFHGGNMGSSPVGITNTKTPSLVNCPTFGGQFIMGGLIFFALDSLLWFYIGINNTDLNYLWKVYVLTVGAHIIYYTLTVAIISPKKFQITLSKIWKTTSKYKFLK